MCPKCGVKVDIPLGNEATSEQGSQPAETASVTGTFPPPPGPSILEASPIVILPSEPVLNTPAPPVVDSIEDLDLEAAPALPEAIPAVPVISVGSSRTTKSRGPKGLAASSSTDRYVAQRARSRQKQFTTAVFLLVAVLMLGVVLILVLKFGTAGSQPVPEKAAAVDPGSHIHYVADASLAPRSTNYRTAFIERRETLGTLAIGLHCG